MTDEPDRGLPPALELGRGAGRPNAPETVDRTPRWRLPHQGEHRWPAALAVLVAVVLQLALPDRLAFQPPWLMAAVELVLFAVLLAANPTRIDRESTLLRLLGLALVVVLTVATAWSAALLVHALLGGGRGIFGVDLLISGAAIWLTNVITFALWYWEADRGGPAARANARRMHPDFLFPQMTAPELTSTDWRPTFVDYLYVSFTNATAFSPTDTLPLSHWAKLTMMAQSAISLTTVALIVARAVNVLGG